MNEPVRFPKSEPAQRAVASEPAPRRVVGSPLPVGNSVRTPAPAPENEAPAARSVPPPGRALTNPEPQPSGSGPGAGMDRAMGVLRMAVPFVQRLLPLLDGNIGTAVASLLAPHRAPATPQHSQVNLEPVESGLAKLDSQHRELRQQVAEQNSSLKRVEDQLEMVREATDRNTLEQQEFLEDLKAVGNKVNAFAAFAFLLLAVSVLVNVILYLHIRRVLP